MKDGNVNQVIYRGEYQWCGEAKERVKEGEYGKNIL
jgi:hypothetical protein